MKTCRYCLKPAELLGDTEPCRRDVVGFPGYRVSCDGRAWSCWDNKGRQTAAWHALKGRKTKHEPRYLQVNLYRDRKPLNQYVHLLVLQAYVGPCPAGLEGCHNDGNSLNNAVGNLRWDTTIANRADAVAHGTFAHGDKMPHAKLTNELVRTMRARRAAGESPEALAKEVGISKRNLQRAIKGDTWAHVQ